MTLLNVFTIEDLAKVKIQYRLFKVKGLLPQSEDFEKNVQLLGEQLSRITKSPCATMRDGQELLVAQPLGYDDPPDRLNLVGASVIIEPAGAGRELDYGHLEENVFLLAIRFLQSYLNDWLKSIPSLWQPSSGMPYYQKAPDPSFPAPEVAMCRGFKMRLIRLPENKVGICVDAANKYVSRRYLPAKISADEFRKYKGRNYVYEFGNDWYEIHVDGISGLNVSEQPMPGGASLFDLVHSKAGSHKSQALLKLPRDCTVLTYKTGLGEVRHAPSALCRMTYKTDHPDVSEFHSRLVLPPDKRRQEIEFIVKRYLAGWKVKDMEMRLADRMLQIDCGVLTPPELEFGGGRVLSLRQSKGATHCTLEEFGTTKRALLHSPDAGFVVKKPLDTQYLVIPKSILETFGQNYIEDLKAQFRRLYSPGGEFQYDPTIISYDDSVGQSVYALGKAILKSVIEAVSPRIFNSGYGLVVIPRLDPRRKDKQDELANLLMREFRRKDIFVSVAHTEVPSASYVPVTLKSGQIAWQATTEKRQVRRFRGYMENLVLNKILLLNHCWPFVLAQPLNTDLIIGLDVKNNTAGFMLVFKDGKTFSFMPSDSDQKEQLSRAHVSTKVYEILKRELEGGHLRIRDITIHRDGKLYPGEGRGIREALDILAREGYIEKGYSCNLVEIKKSSAIPLRFFDTLTPQGSMRERTENPLIGTYHIFDNTAFLCTTGRPFKYKGTTEPLQITKLDGALDLRLILEDVFALSNLTWTKPDYCSKVPISIKMTDIRLREVAGEYEEDKLKFAEEEAEE
jgi:hypothetical protein